MNKAILQKAFREAKKAAGLDFAITSPDNLGDCQSCVWAQIVEDYGKTSRGVWVKHWRRGMNRGAPVEDLSQIYIAHDLTEEQAGKVFEALSRYYTIESGAYNPSRCIVISEGEE
ncbi:MAG: hypothetical protein U0M06_05160 [Clostridia bacterium]|nr:hypothetical protein [Clostridia bacterium]